MVAISVFQFQIYLLTLLWKHRMETEL